jgi:hypothetical protein
MAPPRLIVMMDIFIGTVNPRRKNWDRRKLRIRTTRLLDSARMLRARDGQIGSGGVVKFDTLMTRPVG